MIYGRDAQGRFISRQRAEEQKGLVERTKPTAKIVLIRERIRGTRIAQSVRIAFPIEMSDMEVSQELSSRYDNGKNYVINILSMGIGYLKPGDEFIIDIEGPNSADRSP